MWSSDRRSKGTITAHSVAFRERRTSGRTTIERTKSFTPSSLAARSVVGVAAAVPPRVEPRAVVV